MSPVFPVLRKQDFLIPKCFKSHLAITVQHFWAGCRVGKEAVRQTVACQAPGTELGITGPPQPMAGPQISSWRSPFSESLPRNYHCTGRSCMSCFSEKSGC